MTLSLLQSIQGLPVEVQVVVVETAEEEEIEDVVALEEAEEREKVEKRDLGLETRRPQLQIHMITISQTFSNLKVLWHYMLHLIFEIIYTKQTPKLKEQGNAGCCICNPLLHL